MSMSLKCRFQHHYSVYFDKIARLKSTFWRHRHRFDIFSTDPFSQGRRLSSRRLSIHCSARRRTSSGSSRSHPHLLAACMRDDQMNLLLLPSPLSHSRCRTVRKPCTALHLHTVIDAVLSAQSGTETAAQSHYGGEQRCAAPRTSY